MIRPVSAGGMPPTEFAAPTEMAPGAAHAPSATDVAAAHDMQDPPTKLYDLLGAPSHRQSFYADKGGAGGGQGTQTSKSDPLVGGARVGADGQARVA